MAIEDDVDDKTEKDGEGKTKKTASTMKIVIIAVILASVLSGGIVGLTLFLMGGDDSATAAKTEQTEAEEDETDEGDEDAEEGDEGGVAEGPPIYHRMDPKFVVSFSDQRMARFMQFSIQIMTRDKDVVAQIKEHNPAIRSNLLLLFDTQTAEVMSTREGKESLLVSITDDINASLENLADVSGVEATYFESYVIQ